MYAKIKEIKKLATKDEVDKLIGKPQFKLENLPVYYYGNGLLAEYMPEMLKLPVDKQVDSEEKKLYVTAMYHFVDIEALKEYFRLVSFTADDIERVPDMIIDENITYHHTFQDVHDMKFRKGISCTEGELSGLVDGKMKVVSQFISYNTYTLYFRGESKTDLISGFRYALTV